MGSEDSWMEKNTTEIKKMLNDGDKLYDEGDFAKAKSVYLKVIKLGSLGRSFGLVVDAWLRLGPIYSRQNDYPNMIRAYEDALLVTRTYRLRTKEPMVYKRLGDGYWRVGAFGMAKHYYRTCEETLENIEDQDEKKFLTATLYIDGYGNLMDEEGKFKEAIKYYQKSLGLLEDLSCASTDERIPLYATHARYNMGVAYERHGMSQEKLGRPAKKWFKEATRYFEAVRAKTSESSYEYAISTLDAGFCYSKLDLISKADTYTEMALGLLSKPQLDAKDLVAWAYMNKGIISRKRDNFEEAVLNFNRAIEIYEEIGIHDWISMVYSELGLTYEAMGEEEKSQEAYMRSRAIAKPEREVAAPLGEELEETE
jgi:tetratricopeptide (TPR) repeat protein